MAVKQCHGLRSVRRDTGGGLCPDHRAPGAGGGPLIARSARRGLGYRPCESARRARATPASRTWATSLRRQVLPCAGHTPPRAGLRPGSASPSPGMPHTVWGTPVGSHAIPVPRCTCGPCRVARCGRACAVSRGGMRRGAGRLRGTPARPPCARCGCRRMVWQARGLPHTARRRCHEARWSRRPWQGAARAVGLLEVEVVSPSGLVPRREGRWVAGGARGGAPYPVGPSQGTAVPSRGPAAERRT